MRLEVLTHLTPSGKRGFTPASEFGPRDIESVRVLRISITDRCNFRCLYCMPADGVNWLDQSELLSFEEIVDVVRASIDEHGIRRFKLTGGEPTVRRGLTDLVRMIRSIDGVEDLSLTTNGFALVDLAQPLRESGLDRVTISIDSLDPIKFKQITRTGDLDVVMRGLHRAIDVGLKSIKINCVAMRNRNVDEFADFAKLAIDLPVTVRFIEYMPLGDAALIESGNPFIEKKQDDGRVTFGVSEDEIGPRGGCGAQDRGDVFVDEATIRQSIESKWGKLIPVDRELETGVGPAIPYRFEDHPNARGRLGFISAMSSPFCSTCNRLRLTATGVLRSCLFDGGEVDLRPILRASKIDRSKSIAHAMRECVALKPDVHSVRGNMQMSRIGG